MSHEKSDADCSDSVLRRRAAVVAQEGSSISSPTTLSEAHSVDLSLNQKVNEDAEVMWGRTANGQIFRAPPTHSFVHTLLHTLTTSQLTLVTLASLLAQPALFYILPSSIRSPLFLVYFGFWRAAYDFGLGYVLRKQSEKRYIVRKLRAWGWLSLHNKDQGEQWYKKKEYGGAWWKRELEAKLGADGYRWDAVPEEFNAWLVFRQLVDVILLNDFLSYCLFAISNLQWPPNQSALTHIARWIIGWSLIAFNLWVKVDAHRVVKDYAWYWGDAFWLIVQQKELVFDGVYEIAPHPMYSVGYAGYYGLSIVTGSYIVFFASLVAHAAQFAFLLWFENPHIERTYGGARKPLAGRRSALDVVDESAPDQTPAGILPQDETPSATEGESGTESDSGFEVITPSQSHLLLDGDGPFTAAGAISEMQDQGQAMSTLEESGYSNVPLSMHDLNVKYLQRPVILFSRIDLLRSTDFAFALLVAYAALPSLSAPVMSRLPRLEIGILFLHALAWRIFHSVGLGLLLRAQSRSRWLVRHFLKHYHYPPATRRRMSMSQTTASISQDDMEEVDTSVVQAATEDAFGHWKVIYNISLVMTYVSFTALAWKIYSIPADWTVSGQLLRHILGGLLIALHVWAAISSYEVLGDFGWLYSDFFITDQFPAQLAYTGIYRFLNNPERSMGGAAFLGLALISGSYRVALLALMYHLCHWGFLSFVEQPHMEKLYGNRLRKDGGLVKTLKGVANKQAKVLESKAGRHAPGIKRRMSEVKGTLEKVEGKVTEAVEEFLEMARPRFSEVVQDTKFLLQHSRERMIITRLATDMSAYDPSRYTMSLSSGSTGRDHRYCVGQPIRVSWNAPANHSRRDWIGLYRLGSCKSQLVTRIASLGKWVPLYEDAYEGDDAMGDVAAVLRPAADAGTVLFDKDRLPWTPGQYELRLHHDGKHNVMTRLAPIEIYASPCAPNSTYAEVRHSVLPIIAFALDSDPSLMPASALHLLCADGPQNLTGCRQIDAQSSIASPTAADHEDDNDDFTIMEEKQARRIAAMIELTFGVELSTEVIMADANVGAIARRVLGARSLSVESPRIDGD